MKEKALRVVEAAEILGIHRQTVWNMIRRGDIKAVWVSPGRRAILQSEIDRYFYDINKIGDAEVLEKRGNRA